MSGYLWRAVSVICCHLINPPKLYWLMTNKHVFAHSAVIGCGARLGGSLDKILQAHSCIDICSQLVALLATGWAQLTLLPCLGPQLGWLEWLG